MGVCIITSVLVVVFVILCVNFYFPRITVYGNSMYPTYIDGQKLRAKRITRFEKLQIGAVYVFYAPDDEDKALIKRLVYIHKSNYSHIEYCYFLGDNAIESRDSRKFGYVSRKNIIAKVL